MYKLFAKAIFLTIFISACASTETISPPTASNLTHTENHLGRSISPETAQQVELVRTLTGHTDKVLALTFSGDGVYIASDSLDKTIRLWNVRSGQSVHTLSKGESEMIITNGIAFSPNGNLLASAEAIWDVKSGDIVHVLNTGQHAPVAFSPDGSLLAIALFNQPPKLWNVTSGQVADSFVKQPRNADNLSINIAFSPDGAWVAAAGHLDGTVRLWDVHSGQIVRSLSHGTESNIHALAFSPDEQLLASAGTDATVRIWDAASGQQVRSLGHRAGSWSVAFSPDGSLLASAGCNGTVQIWEVTSGKLLRTLDHNDQVTAVIFSPDGTLLVSGGYDNQIYLWGVQR